MATSKGNDAARPLDAKARKYLGRQFVRRHPLFGVVDDPIRENPRAETLPGIRSTSGQSCQSMGYLPMITPSAVDRARRISVTHLDIAWVSAFPPTTNSEPVLT